MNLQQVQSLLNRLDEMGILNPATYSLGLNDDPNKVRFMDDYTKQMQWITDAYAVLMHFGDQQDKSEQVQSLLTRLDEMGIMNPATYSLGLNDDPDKVRFMNDYTKQMQWITDVYAVLESFDGLPKVDDLDSVAARQTIKKATKKQS